MDRLTLAIAAGAVTTIMMLAFLTLTDPADAQTQPKQAILFKANNHDLACEGFTTLMDIKQDYDEFYEPMWRSWTDEDIIMLHGDTYGRLILLGGNIDRASDVFTVKGFIDHHQRRASKITIQGHCDSSWANIIIENETLRIENSRGWSVACYGN